MDELKSQNIGMDIQGEKLTILLYADDVVLIAENAEDLKKWLDALV